MSEFAIRFSVSPWLLLLLIPGLAVPLILHFTMNKERRRTRNRIVALVLHCMAISLCIFALAGIFFSWELPDERNELVILVDSSFSTGTAKDRADKFVREILDANDGRCKTSIVTFGYDQKIALEPGVYSADEAFKTYQNAPKPDDTTATDICAALKFCWDPVNDKSGEDTPVITYPQSARIVVISDGVETDQKAQSVVRMIMMDGVRIDTTFFGNEQLPDMWISNVEYPDRNFKVGEPVSFQVEIKSSLAGKATLTLSDTKGETVITQPAEERSIAIGSTTITVNHAFSSAGHHEIKFDLISEDDPLADNNVYYTYFDLDEECKVLIIEKYEGESAELVKMFDEKVKSGVLILDVMTLGKDSGKIPQNATQMQEYDEIILVNIANSDFDPSFWENLQIYVQQYGGGLFTIGGLERDQDGNPIYLNSSDKFKHAKPHAYNKEDMQGTIYQEMLPVDVIDYTPPVGLMIIIDCSGSMVEHSLVEVAVNGALACVEELSPRDYVGVTIIGDTYETPLEMTPLAKKGKVTKEIKNVCNLYSNNTMYTPSFEEACRVLAGLPSEVQRKHILLLSDGGPGEGEDTDFYEKVFRKYEAQHITMTVTCLDNSTNKNVRKLAEKMNTELHMFPTGDLSTLPEIFLDDLDFDEELSGAIEDNYNIEIKSHTDTLKNINDEKLEAIRLGGYFTTAVKGYNNVENPLLAKYVPLYAQWKYGAGRVGSYMCDIGGQWGNSLFSSDQGKQLMENIVFGLLPTVDITVNSLSAKFIEDNYRTQVSVYNFDSEEEKGQKLVAYVRQPGSEEIISRYDLSELSPGGNRFTFENKAEGVYTVTIVKVPKSFNPFAHDVYSAQSAGSATLRTYRAFSYSKEYLTEADTYTNGKLLMIALSSRNDVEGEDKFVYDAETIMDNFHFLVKNLDPRIYLFSAAIILLLLGVAARKFKFKWPHELFSRRKASE